MKSALRRVRGEGNLKCDDSTDKFRDWDPDFFDPLPPLVCFSCNLSALSYAYFLAFRPPPSPSVRTYLMDAPSRLGLYHRLPFGLALSLGWSINHSLQLGSNEWFILCPVKRN